jgi:GcrA cell cycle regulator
MVKMAKRMEGNVMKKWWSQAEIDHLVKEWAAGVKSATMIAKELGKSRNSVIGRAHRMKLGYRQPLERTDKKKSVPRLVPREEVVVKVAKIAKVVEVVEEKDEVVAPAEGHSLFDLREDQCRWPLSDVMRACGATKMEGSSYCPEHSQKAYVKRHPSASASLPPMWRKR